MNANRWPNFAFELLKRFGGETREHSLATLTKMIVARATRQNLASVCHSAATRQLHATRQFWHKGCHSSEAVGKGESGGRLVSVSNFIFPIRFPKSGQSQPLPSSGPPRTARIPLRETNATNSGPDSQYSEKTTYKLDLLSSRKS